MTLPDLLSTIRRRWLSLFCFTLLGVAGSLGLTATAVPLFSAATQLYVAVQAPESATAGDIGQGNNAAQQKIRSYMQVVTSSEVLQPVIDELHLGSTPDALASRVSVTSPPNSVILVVTVRDTNAARAATTANALGASFRKVVGKLEAPADGASGLVRISTIEPAVESNVPVSPKPIPNVAVGLALGLLLGLAFAVLRNVLDTKIRGEVDVVAVTGKAVLGGIGFDPESPEKPLIVQIDPRNPRAESFRALRTNLQFIDAGTRARRFLLTSAMPGEGKTTTVSNLAIAVAESGARVLVIDADLRRPRLAEVMGLEGAVGLTDILIGHAEFEDVTQPWGSRRLHVLPAGQIPPNPSELLGSQGMQTLMELVESRYDYVIIDTPPILPVTDAAVLSKLTDGVIVVSAVGRSTRPQLERATATLAGLDSRVLGIVLTMIPMRGPYRSRNEAYSAYYGPSAHEAIRAARLRRRKRTV